VADPLKEERTAAAWDGPVPMIDLKAQYATLASELDAAIARVVQSQMFILGPEVDAFEREIERYLGVKHAIGCASGSDAILLALMALGYGPGDEVIMTPYTFFATAGSTYRLGIRPVFCDIDPVTYNLDPTKIEEKLTRRTRAIMPVHLFGQCADLDAIGRIARGRELAVVEDAAQIIGATYNGRHAGTLGDAGCFSFFPTKNLGAWGDAGMVTTNDDELAARVRALRVHGGLKTYHHELVGMNSRLDGFQGAVLRAKLPHLSGWNAQRGANAARYRELFAQAGVLQSEGDQPERGKVIVPAVVRESHIFHQYVMRVHATQRDGLLRHLQSRQIGCAIYYPVPLHLQPCFAELGYRAGDLPEAERASRETLALPIYPELPAAAQERVVEVVAEFLRG